MYVECSAEWLFGPGLCPSATSLESCGEGTEGVFALLQLSDRIIHRWSSHQSQYVKIHIATCVNHPQKMPVEQFGVD